MKIIKGLTFGEERALYGIHDTCVDKCRFEGDEDGESALKECGGIEVENCDFRLRYPLWHLNCGSVRNSRMYDTCRAALWYCNDITVDDCYLGGIKALRECDRTTLNRTNAVSTEFGWFCRGISAKDLDVTSEYAFMKSRNLTLDRLNLTGKYSFQYVENAEISNSTLNTKDAFWHSRNVTVSDSEINGEYLGWYSESLTLIRCKINGTQPLCYSRGLVLVDCVTENCDLSFENSDVTATVTGDIVSVKNPVSGSITADSIGEIIIDEHIKKGADCKITVRKAKV